MNREQGFTLVELLAALVAGGLLLAFLSWTVGSLGREVRSPNRVDGFEQVEAITPALVALLEGAFPLERDGSGFMGETRRIVALVSPPQALGDVGPVRLELEARPTARGEGLFLALAVEAGTVKLPKEVSGPRLLADGFRTIRFDYVRQDEPGRKRLPRLVTISFTDGDGATLPIVIAPRLTSDGRCRFDPISMTCRA